MRLQDLPTKTEPDEDLDKERARQKLIALAAYRASLSGDEPAYFDYETRDVLAQLAVEAGINLTLNKGKPRPEVESGFEPEFEFDTLDLDEV